MAIFGRIEVQYLVDEVQGKASQTGDAKVFRNIPDVVKHLRKINKGDNLKIGNEPLSEALLESLLAGRLSTAIVSNENKQDKSWVVTAF